MTPHLNGHLTEENGALASRLDRLVQGYVTLCDAARAAGLRVPDFGQEVLLPAPERMTALSSDPRVGYAGTNYVLVEYGFRAPYAQDR